MIFLKADQERLISFICTFYQYLSLILFMNLMQIKPKLPIMPTDRFISLRSHTNFNVLIRCDNQLTTRIRIINPYLKYRCIHNFSRCLFYILRHDSMAVWHLLYYFSIWICGGSWSES